MIPDVVDFQGSRGRSRLLWAAAALLLLAVLVVLTGLLPEPPAGKTDLRAYWGAGFLLREGESFTDYDRMARLQQTATGWPVENGAMMTWNPPWILPLFVPLSLLPYDQAVWLWLLLAIGLTLISFHWLGRPAPAPRARWRNPIRILLGLSFVPWLQMVAIGQIGVLILFGLAGSLHFRDKRPWLAGVLLLLTTAKPHVVFLTLPLLLVEAVWHRRWRFLGGFLLALLGATGVTFLFRPAFVLDYITGMSGGQGVLLSRPSPTVPALLSTLAGFDALRFSGLLLLPWVLWWWWRREAGVGRSGPSDFLVGQTLLLSAIFAPYGYPFDFITLLIPLALVWEWAVRWDRSAFDRLLLLILFIAGNVMALRLQLSGALIAQFWWVPLWVSLVYWAARQPAATMFSAQD